MENKHQWWRGAVIYQIYPRSFLDTNGDGIGDLPGITRKLDYISSLGVDAVWISPFFKSPMKDFGYDISDYRDIDPLFGLLHNFKELLEKAHDLKLKIIVDLVLSHTSDQHPWFAERPEYYVWADARADGAPPNNWRSVFGGSAWEWHAGQKKFYLHNFLKEQPDLNFHNPDVQEAALDIARYWLDMGVDGFRLDVANFYFHDALLRDNPPRTEGTAFATQFEGEDPYSAQQHIFDKSQPENLEFLKRLRMLTDEYPDRFTVGEIGDDNPVMRSVEYTRPGLLHTTYNTQLMGGTHKTLSTDLFRTPIESFENAGQECWPSWAFSNHDVVRAVSRWNPDRSEYSRNPELAKLLITLLGCLRGTIFLYQGEELGLPEAQLTFEDLQDPWGIHLWPVWQGRDGCRTPMPWDDQKNAGFTSGTPWLPIPENHAALNAESQEKDEESVLNFTRRFLKWRTRQPALKSGTIAFLDDRPDHILAFVRHGTDQKIICSFDLKNFKAEIREAGGETLWGI